MAKNSLDIIYEDDDIVIVNKPAGMLTIADRYRADIPSVINELRKKYQDILTVHRLDKDTSGVVCFARNASAHRHLSKQFEEHTPKKVYWLLVEGCMEAGSEGVIDAPIGENEAKLGTMRIMNKGGKASITNYKAVGFYRHFSVVEATPLTGRTHQIRVHLAHIGYPPAVDPFYGQRDKLFLSDIKQRKFNLKKHTDEQPLLSRVPLHALSLTIQHPTTLEPMTFEAPLTKDLQATTRQLSKWDALKPLLNNDSEDL